MNQRHEEELDTLLPKNIPVADTVVAQHPKLIYPDIDTPTPTTPAAADESEETPKEIQHKIQLGDTLQGLSLQYGVSIMRIKQFNNLNSNDIYYLKSVKIPNPQSNLTQEPIDAEEQERRRKQILTEAFMCELKKEDKSAAVAKFYLQEAEWDIYKAADLYKQDLEWEKKTVQDKKKQEKGAEPVAMTAHQAAFVNFKNSINKRLQNMQGNSYYEVEMMDKKTM